MITVWPLSQGEQSGVHETFVVNEILKQASWLTPGNAAGHFRSKDGAEVDLVLETDDGRIIVVEVKAAGMVSPSDFSGLRTLRSATGEAFLAGVVLHLGTRSFTQSEGMFALPVDRLWN